MNAKKYTDQGDRVHRKKESRRQPSIIVFSMHGAVLAALTAHDDVNTFFQMHSSKRGNLFTFFVRNRARKTETKTLKF